MKGNDFGVNKNFFSVIQLLRYFSVELVSYTLNTGVLSVPHFQLSGEKDFQLIIKQYLFSCDIQYWLNLY